MEDFAITQEKEGEYRQGSNPVISERIEKDTTKAISYILTTLAHMQLSYKQKRLRIRWLPVNGILKTTRCNWNSKITV